MKRVSKQRRRYLIKRAFTRRNRQLGRQKLAKVRLTKQTTRRLSTVFAPETIALHANASASAALCQTIRELSHKVLTRKLRVKLSFRNTVKILAEGAILLFAEIDRIITLSGQIKPITIKNPLNQQVHEVLAQIGIYKLTGDMCSVEPTREDVIYWKVTKGIDQTGDVYGRLIEQIAADIAHNTATRIKASAIYEGVSEAVINSVEHAYNYARKDGFRGLSQTKWWMFTHVRGDRLSVVVCDLGCGFTKTIHKHIPAQFINECLAMFESMNKDARAIKIAMAYGKSSTNQSNRGKGSRDFLSVLENNIDGQLLVMSNSGSMEYLYKDGQQTGIRHANTGVDIGGTIVWWHLPLTGEQNADR